MGILIRTHILILALICGFAIPAAHATSAEDKPLQLFEQKIKAGLVYNFLKYTNWPTTPTRLQVCLFGDDPFDGYLSPLQGRTAQQSVIDITTVKDVQETANCNMVIIPRSRANALPQLLSFLDGKQVLTISDINRFAQQGGMVELNKDGQKVGMAINKAAVDHAGLTIQDQMLKLSKLVGG